MSDKIKGRERAIILAQLAQQSVPILHNSIKDSVRQAEEILVAAEELVATKYGEFR